MVKVASIADELTQDLFLKIWDKRKLIDPDKNFEALIFRMGQNLVYDFYRKLARDQKMQDEVISLSTELYSHTEENIFYKERKAIIDQAIEKLPQQQRQVFMLCKIEGKTYEEVSQLLNISRSTVSNHIVAATKTIRHVVFNDKKTALLLIAATFLHKL
ncbi:ECF RNA polymerase sigma factor SigE [compost metagenome]